jgi:uncharacterized membrane-anchored protein YitT (DUF2179 family)
VITIEVGSLILLLNVPLLIIATWKFGWKFLISTFYAIGCTSVFTNLFTIFVKNAATDDPILVALGGGALSALGIGLVFRAGGTTGGTDIVVRLLKRKQPHMKTGLLFFIVDMLVVSASVFVFRNIETAMYSAISLLTYSLVADVVLYGRDEAKLIYVITNNPEEIAETFMKELNVGATYIQAKGAYHKVDKEVIMCVLRKQKYPKAEEIVKELDPEAFLIVTSATEIYGEGYKNLFSEKY